MQRRFIEQYLGTVRPVLLEQPHAGAPMHGFTDNYIRVNVTPDERLVNRVADVKLLTLNDDLTVEAQVI
jgi:threonylcarbamoyladenosine tRNA methylthiotransferase MtaB